MALLVSPAEVLNLSKLLLSLPNCPLIADGSGIPRLGATWFLSVFACAATSKPRMAILTAGVDARGTAELACETADLACETADLACETADLAGLEAKGLGTRIETGGVLKGPLPLSDKAVPPKARAVPAAPANK
jgi:hypothetical protein